jgi:flagellar biosynthesis protein
VPEKKKEIRHKAVALKYDAQKDAAPRVIAKGSGIVAERIIEIAREYGIQTLEDPDLVALLSKLDVNVQIPEALYLAVAEVLAFVYRLNKKAPPRPAGRTPSKGGPQSPASPVRPS